MFDYVHSMLECYLLCAFRSLSYLSLSSKKICNSIRELVRGRKQGLLMQLMAESGLVITLGKAQDEISMRSAIVVE